MPKPWEKFKGTAETKPWEKFGGSTAPKQEKSWMDEDYGPTIPFVGHEPLRPRQVIQSVADSLPGLGAMVGGGLGAAGSGGVAALPAAGYGGAAGQTLKDQIEMHLLGKPKTALQLALGPVQGAVDGTGQEIIGQGAGELLHQVGTPLYRSAFKNLDRLSAKYGKEPVSDVLMKNRIAGSAGGVQEQMDALGDKLLANKNNILQQATANGGEVDMNRAVKEAQDFVDRGRYIDNHEQRGFYDAAQKRVDGFRNRGAQEAQDTLRELPFTKEQNVLIPQGELTGYKTNGPTLYEKEIAGRAGMPPSLQSNATEFYMPQASGAKQISREDADVIHNPVDEIIGLPRPMAEQKVLAPEATTILDRSERVAGPSPIQVDAWKTTAANAAGDDAYRVYGNTVEGRALDKALARGQKQAVEESVGQYHPMGSAAQREITQTNADLGGLLTTQERAAMDADIEARKNNFTSIDGIIAHDPTMLAAKKAADLMKTTAFRSRVGRGLEDLGGSRAGQEGMGYLLSPSTNLQTNIPPWLKMGDQ